MKNLVLIPLLVLLAIPCSYSQCCLYGPYRKYVPKMHQNVPNYLLADNSNFVVNVFTLPDMTPDYDWNGIAGEVERIDESQFASPGNHFFGQLVRLMNIEFRRLNMRPAAYFNLDMMKMGDAYFMKKWGKEYQKHKPGFIINIGSINWDKALKAYAKGELTLNKVKPVSFSIVPMTDAKVIEEMFTYRRVNMSLGTGFRRLEKAIEKKPDSFFLEEMVIHEEIFEGENFDPGIIDKMLEEKDTLLTFPAESKLMDNPILVLVTGPNESAHFQSSLRKVEKYYPYNFRIVDPFDLRDALKEGYDYLLYPKGYMVERHVQDLQGEGTKIKTQYKFYYVLKDLKSLSVYFPADLQTMEENATINPSLALKKTLLEMNEHYKWEERW